MTGDLFIDITHAKSIPVVHIINIDIVQTFGARLSMSKSKYIEISPFNLL